MPAVGVETILADLNLLPVNVTFRDAGIGTDSGNDCTRTFEPRPET